MRIVSIFLLLSITISSNGQIDGLYQTDSGERLYFKNDSIAFRLRAKGGFIVYNYGFGKYQRKNNKYKLTDMVDFRDYSSIISEFPKDSIQVILLSHINSDPIWGANVFIKDVSGNLIYRNMTDRKGILNIEGIDSIFNKRIQVEVSSMDFETIQTFCIKEGYSYEIKSLIPKRYPFINGWRPKKFFIDLINDSEIILRKKRKEEGKKFLKISNCDNCIDALLQNCEGE